MLACSVPVMGLLIPSLIFLITTTVPFAACVAADLIACFFASDFAKVLSFCHFYKLSACLFQHKAMLEALYEMTCMAYLPPYLLHMIQAIYIQCILIIICLIHTYTYINEGMAFIVMYTRRYWSLSPFCD